MPPDSRTFVFTDLDDTLIQTEGKLPDRRGSEVGALDRDGRALSFISAPQLELLRLFQRGGATVIPVTGRNTEAINRVTLAFFDSYRIVSHGALVLRRDGAPCRLWLERLRSHHDLPRWATRLQQLNRLAQRIIEQRELPARSRVITDAGVPGYVSIKCESGDQVACAFDTLTEAMNAKLPRALRWHRNGRNMALLAPYTCKRQAVRFVAEQLAIGPNDLTMGLGDSLTDIPFLREAHFGVFPIGSQIDRELRLR